MNYKFCWSLLRVDFRNLNLLVGFSILSWEQALVPLIYPVHDASDPKNDHDNWANYWVDRHNSIVDVAQASHFVINLVKVRVEKLHLRNSCAISPGRKTQQALIFHELEGIGWTLNLSYIIWTQEVSFVMIRTKLQGLNMLVLPKFDWIDAFTLWEIVYLIQWWQVFDCPTLWRVRGNIIL